MWKFAAALFSVLALGAQDASRLSVESLYHPQHRITYVEAPVSRYVWRANGTLVEERAEPRALPSLHLLGIPAWTARPLLERGQLEAALTAAGAEPETFRDPGALVWNGARDAFVLKLGAELFLVDPAAAKARRLGAGDTPAFSPDGAWVAFLAENDVRAVELATGREVQVTTGGDALHLNGRLDWVYQEEVFNQRGDFRAFWWSPDSRRIAFLNLDESQVPVYTLMDDRFQPQRAVPTAYPKAGDPNPVPRLGVATLDGQVAWMEDPYPGQEILIPRVGWTPDGKLVAHFTDRTQTWLDCRVFEGAASRVLVQEHSRTWVDHVPLPHFLKDGRFLWLSARAGFHHLYLHDAHGRLLAPLTSGPWDVRRILGVDEAKGKVYFEGTQRSAVGLDAYRCDLEGVNQDLLLITKAPGTHALTFAPGFQWAVDRWSDVDTPAQDDLLDGEGLVLHRGPSGATAAFQGLRKGKVVFQQVRTKDGFPMETMLVLPPGFDPARKYPVFQSVYGGPNTPMVRNAFGRDLLWFHFLAQQGIVVWICDNRSASAKGPAAAGVYRNLGAEELRDQLDGLDWLRSQGWADMNRIALEGYSYGGFLTAYALTHSKAWKLGIIGAPVTDWRLYDSVYAERLMGLPKDNPQGYEAASAVAAAAHLGGRIMLIHGTLDTNVHPQNSVQFLDALQKAGFSAPLVLLPGSGHSPRAPQHQWARYEGMWAFLKGNL